MLVNQLARFSYLNKEYVNPRSRTHVNFVHIAENIFPVAESTLHIGDHTA